MSIIYAIRTTVGREETVLENVALALKRKDYKVKALVLPKEIKGYVIAEADSISDLEEAIHGVNHVRGLVKKPLTVEEIKHFLIAKPAKMRMEKGDTVELVSGPFKGEKAKVTRVDKTKREVTVELIEAAVPIPVTVAVESLRVVKHINEETEQKEA